MKVDLLKKELKTVQETLFALHDKRESSLLILRQRTQAVDQLIVQLFIKAFAQLKEKIPLCIVAQGGYGRQEMCFHSDVDLLFLYAGKDSASVEFVTEKVLHVLWDLGFDVGHAVRTVNDCKKIMMEDLTALTSMIDARYLIGDQDLWQEMQSEFWKNLRRKNNQQKFVTMKREESKERLKKYGDSIYLLEPNIKDGEGGLRDYHSVRWLYRVSENIQDLDDFVERGFAKEKELAALKQATEFMWTVRNELHRRNGRKSDQLIIDHQTPIAEWLGFKNTDQFLAVEHFMKQYYTHAAQIYRFSDHCTKKLLFSGKKTLSLFSLPTIQLKEKGLKILRGRLTVTKKSIFQENPAYLLKIFKIALDRNLEIDEYTQECIAENLHLIDDGIRESAESRETFLSLLIGPGPVGKILSLMHELRVLDAYLPEFKNLQFRFQHTIYHVYTVDVHSIFAVQELVNFLADKNIEKLSVATDVAKNVLRKDLLAFAIFYHDIGKGEGSGHVEKGARLIKEAGQRMGFTDEDIALMEFLERSHLIMTQLAFRRDLEDPGLIIHFAKSMPSLEHLNLLYILTICDVMATNPEALNQWRANLLRTLFLRARQVIEEGAHAPEKMSILMDKAVQEIVKLDSGTLPFQEIYDFVHKMPARYIVANPPELILSHITLNQRLAQEPVVVSHRNIKSQRVSEITIMAQDSPQLFSKACGVMMGNNVNVLAAQLNVSNKGEAIYALTVTDSQGGMIDSEAKWNRIEQNIHDVMNAKIFVKSLVVEKFKPSLLGKRSVIRKQPTEIEVDNDISGYYTVIDITTNDRVGLLYQITSTLYSLGLYVDVSKILTKANIVSDIFYVKDIFGQKILSTDRLEKIRNRLFEVIDEVSEKREAS
jgi:[protein-PII] uridylyltransferase